MNPWLALALEFLLCCGGAYLSYGPYRNHHLMPWACGALACACGALWGLAVQGMDAQKVYTFSLIWDASVFAAYQFLPLVVVRPHPKVIFGAALVFAGVMLAKWGDE